jgi:hypothetical protein
MNSSEELRQHAVECERMANLLRDRRSRAEWTAIADRYMRIAQWYDNRRSLADELRHLRENRKAVLRLDYAHS